METRQLTSNDAHQAPMTQFLLECDNRGFMNNNTLDAMKYDWCIEDGGQWWATFDGNRIISLSGIHPFRDGYRALFRGVQIETNRVGLNKHHMQSYCFHSQLPFQIDYAGTAPIYITTNTDNDASGKMGRINRIFGLLEHLKMVDHVSVEEVFYVKQNIWKLNTPRYQRLRQHY